jgi:hypothetical protein
MSAESYAQWLWDQQSVASWPNDPKAAQAASLPAPNEPEPVRRGKADCRDAGNRCMDGGRLAMRKYKSKIAAAVHEADAGCP